MLAQEQTMGRENERSHRGYAHGQAIHAIEKVHGVHSAEEPEEGGERGEIERDVDQAVAQVRAERVRHLVDRNPAGKRDGGSQDLASQLGKGWEIESVVHGSEQDDDQAPGDEPCHPGNLGGGPFRERRVGCHQGQQHRRVDGDAAQARLQLWIASRGGTVVKPPTGGGRCHQRRQQKCTGERHGERNG